MLAYAVAPFAKWLMHRFKLNKSTAAGITAIALAATGALVIFGVEFGIARLAIRLPIYAQRLNIIYEQATTFLNAHGIATSDFSIKDVLTIERLSEVSFLILPAAGTILAKGFLILLLAFLSIIEMLPAEGYKLSPWASYCRATASTRGGT